MAERKTVYALSSAPGRAAIAVVRVTGPEAGAAVSALTGRETVAPRQAVLAKLRGRAGEVLDSALVLWFPGPASETGEDVAEFQIHGGRAIVEAVLDALGQVPGLSPAEPGDFTRRAVENGKFDLTAAEALADLIDAETEAQRRQAWRQHEGALAALYDGWRSRLIAASAWAEASIDFSDEEVPENADATARAAIGEIAQEIQSHMDDAHRGELVREGLYITVIGKPNSGKSTLVNLLARRNVAIVAETAGTTRDVIEVRMDLGGYAVTVADTAGLREAAEAVEAEGVRRALARAEAADIVLLVLDGTAADPLAGIPAEARDKAGLIVWNKADLGFSVSRRGEEIQGLTISAKTGEGIPALVESLTGLVKERLAGAGEAPVLTRARHRAALEEAAAALARAAQAPAGAPELMAEDMRLALRSLGRITGRVDIEELLDVVFRDFCIGK